MRSIKELLQLMLDNQQSFRTGLCRWVDYMYHDALITDSESRTLSLYIREHHPFLFKIYKRHGLYYWKPGDINPRIAWIKKHIKKNK